MNEMGDSYNWIYTIEWHDWWNCQWNGDIGYKSDPYPGLNK